MVWGCITGQGMGRLHHIEGIMCGLNYIEILDKDYLSTLKDLKLRWTGKEGVIVQQDNDPKHTPKKADKWFSDHNIIPLKWPAKSPDLNPIEHLWQQLKAKLQQYDTPPTGVHELWERVAKEWTEIPPETCQKLIESMPRRIQAVLKAKGGHTKY